MSGELQQKGIVFNIQKFSIHDGPGIRTLVFLKGCPLRCQWCSNPESISPEPQIMLLHDRCTTCGICVAECPAGIHRMAESAATLFRHVIDRTSDCTGCGKCVAACPAKAVRLAGQEMSVAEVMDVVLEDSSFYWNSGGGITIGGGEPTMQAGFVKAILAESKEQGLHTAIETCGFTSWETLRDLSTRTDLFLYDLKHICSESHEELTGVSNERILGNLTSLLEHGAAVTVRMPLISGKNDQRIHLEQTMRFLEKQFRAGRRLQGIEVLPYHRLGLTKYAQLDEVNPMADMPAYDESALAEIERFLRSFDLPLKMVRL